MTQTTTGVTPGNLAVFTDVKGNIGNGPSVASLGGGGSVTSVSVTSANGFAGQVTMANTTPAITLATTITGMIKGNGTAISAATAGSDYVAPATTVNGHALSSNVVVSASDITTGTLPAAQLPAATSSSLGAVKPDNSTITILAGVLSAAKSIGALLNVQILTSSGTYIPTAGTNNILAIAQGGGGGGGGSGTGGSSSNNGGAGNVTSLGTLISANGGIGGLYGGSASTSVDGAVDGGISGAIGTLKLSGTPGGPGLANVSTTLFPGGSGGPGLFGQGSGRGGSVVSNPQAGLPGRANSGGGAGGASGVSSSFGSASGGSSGSISIYYGPVSGNQTATIGAGGTAGIAASSGQAGGIGGSGVIIILEFK